MAKACHADMRTLLEQAVARAAFRARGLELQKHGYDAIRAAQDEWSDATAALATYLLATGEKGWIGEGCSRAELRRMPLALMRAQQPISSLPAARHSETLH